MTCEEFVAAYLADLRARFTCRIDATGRLCITTPYLHPDHDNIEIFVRSREDGTVTISDLGETLRRLDAIGLDMDSPGDFTKRVSKIADGFDVTVESGVLVKRGPVADLGDLSFSIIAVCKEVGDLAHHSRPPRRRDFVTETEEFLEQEGFQAERNANVTGMSGASYRVDFRVRDTRRMDETVKPSLIQTLPLRQAVAGRSRVNSIFRTWSDLESDQIRYTLVDDRKGSIAQPEISILERVSPIFHWSNRHSMAENIRSRSIA